MKCFYKTALGRAAIMCVLLVLATWIHIPFAPLSWNLSFFVSVMLAICLPQREVLCAILFWIVLGMYAGVLPIAMQNLSAPWGGYIWGVLPAVWLVDRVRKNVSPWILWGLAWGILETVSALHYACTSPNVRVAKCFGLCALLPWHGIQCVFGALLTHSTKRFLRRFFICT